MPNVLLLFDKGSVFGCQKIDSLLGWSFASQLSRLEIVGVFRATLSF